MKNIILNRTDFKDFVFKRDNYKCVVCGKDAVDAHHIIDRNLFADGSGGYYLDNGVSLCEEHHIQAEQTILSCEELRTRAKITNKIYPHYLSFTEFVVDYDKWCNPILKNGNRLKGYFFENENVQKIIKPVLNLFEKMDRLIDKYPRTYHFLFSPGTTSDDRISTNIQRIINEYMIITEKLDGENTSESEFGIFARSRVEPTKNPWAKWLQQKYELIKNDLKSFNIEFCGENMFAEHSIVYSNLEDHLYIFGIRDTKRDVFLSWEEVEYYSALFDFKTVPVLFKGKMNSEEELQSFIKNTMKTSSILSDDNIWKTPKEGVVCRIANEFPNDMFYNSVFKNVRAKHVKTDEHWSRNWSKAKLHSELLNYDTNKLKQIYKKQIEEGLINL